MDTTYKAFRNWDTIDDEEYLCIKDKENRQIDDPELNQDDPEKRQEFDDSDDFHKYDDTDDTDDDTESGPDPEDSGKNDGTVAI